MLDPDTILSYLSMNKDYLMTKYFIDKIGIVGSFARGDFNEKSDIDFIVYFNEEAKRHRIFRLYNNLQEELETHFDRKVDIIVNGTVLPAFQDIILKEVRFI
ncbi:MAG: nucleotidyltransferase domain-containing protein [Salinivirgaceae bacterium]|jgi:hypothetical protein